MDEDDESDMWVGGIMVKAEVAAPVRAAVRRNTRIEDRFMFIVSMNSMQLNTNYKQTFQTKK